MSEPEHREVDTPGHRELDAPSVERFRRVCEMSDERLARMTPAERDRMIQTHLAAARGPARNLELLCDLTDTLLVLRRTQQSIREGR